MTNSDTQPPKAPIKAARKGVFKGISFIWFVPVIALAAVVGIAVQNYLDKGPVIHISFENASGVQKGATELRYRDVTVGVVEDVGFTDGLGRVEVTVRLDKEVADYVDAGAQFWVVRPQVTAQGVSGLSTVLSGVYIEGFWDNTAEGLTEEFAGLADAPLDRSGEGGLRLLLRATGDATLTANAPILFRGISVGRLGSPTISADGSTAEVQAVIFAPHDKLINSATRFWDASGFSFSFGPGGAALDFSSVASLVSGGVTFETMISGGDPAASGDVFTVFSEEAAARASLFAPEDGDIFSLSAVFDDNIAGLAVDAPVELNGFRIGRVSAINGLIDDERFGDHRVRLAVSLAIRQGRLGLADGAGDDAVLDYFRTRVSNGLRARLATASILTGGLKVELVEVADGTAAELSDNEEGYPIIPTTENEIADVSATAEGVFERINALPVEEVMQQAINLMANASALISSDDTRAVPGNVNNLLSDARGLVNSEDLRALPAQLGATVTELDKLITQFNEAAVAAQLTAALAEATTAAQSVNSSVAGVPDLITRMNAIAANVEKLGIEAIGNDLSALLATTETLLASDETKALPGQLNVALADLSALLTKLGNSKIIENAETTLVSASKAADTFAESGKALPALIKQMQGVVAQALTTLEGYEANGGLGREARLALAEIQKAAKAVASLAKAIERNPNSLLTGR